MPNAQQQLTDLLTQMITDGKEWGIQLTAYLNGQCVIDIALGVMDDKTRQPVEKSTLFPVFSVSKGITSTVMHKLAEQGKLNYDMPIAEVWPEFAATHAEKKTITVRHVMGHVSGMQYMPMGIGLTEFVNWDAMCDAIARQAPANAPGEKQEYHAITFGFLLGEVARRVDGRPFGQILREEVAMPLGIEDELYMGIPDEAANRVATLMHIYPEGEPVVDDSIPQAIPGWSQPLHRMMNRADTQGSCSPGSGGIMSAGAIAKHYASLLSGGVDGVQLISDDQIALATAQQFPELESAVFGLGYQYHNDRSTFGHGGFGGAQGFADPANKLAVGMTHNLFCPDHQGEQIKTALYEALSLPA